MRPSAVPRCLAAIAAVGTTTICASAQSASATTAEVHTFLSNVNALRALRHVAPLAENATLDAKAVGWAGTMAARHTLFHSDLTAGIGGLSWIMLGENVGE